MHYLPVLIFCSTWLGEEPLQNHQSGCGCLWSLQEISRTRDPPVSAFGIQTGCSYSTCPSRELLHSAFGLKSSPWQRKKNPMSCRFLSQKTSGFWRLKSDTNQNALVSFVQLWSLHPRKASMSYMNCEAPRGCVFFHGLMHLTQTCGIQYLPSTRWNYKKLPSVNSNPRTQLQTLQTNSALFNLGHLLCDELPNLREICWDTGDTESFALQHVSYCWYPFVFWIRLLMQSASPHFVFVNQWREVSRNCCRSQTNHASIRPQHDVVQPP